MAVVVEEGREVRGVEGEKVVGVGVLGGWEVGD